MSVPGVTLRAGTAGLHSALAASPENVNIFISQLSTRRRRDYIFSDHKGIYIFFSTREALNRVRFFVLHFSLVDSREGV